MKLDLDYLETSAQHRESMFGGALVLELVARIRGLEKQCAENAAFAQKSLEREVLGRSRIAKLEKKLAEAPANYENGDAFEKDITT